MDILATTPGIAEAPCVVGDEVWFSDLLHGIFALDATGNVLALSDRRGVGGLVPHVDGGAVASGRSLIHLQRDGFQTELLARPDGSTGFNDLITTARGDVVVGLLTYRPLAGESPTPGQLLRVGSGGVEQLAVGPVWPNGIGTVNDGEFYVADFSTGNVLRLLPDGRLETLATLDEGHADGMAIDTLGRIWIATGPGQTIVALTPDGAVDVRVPIPAGFVASVALSPSGGPALVAVGGLGAANTGGLLAVDVGAQGAPIPHATLMPSSGPLVVAEIGSAR